MTSFDPARIRPNPANLIFLELLTGFPADLKPWKMSVFTLNNIIFRLCPYNSARIRPNPAMPISKTAKEPLIASTQLHPDNPVSS